MATERIRAVVVDDEPLGRRAVRLRLEDEPDVEVVAECAGGGEAVRAVREHRPDVVFLDVRMPGMDGFDVLRRLDPEHAPAVIFVTAHDRHAVEAFEVGAVDYLLKPFTRERFRDALERARAQLATGDRTRMAAGLRALLARLDRLEAAERGAGRFLQRLQVREEDRIFFVPVEDVDWLEAERNYVAVHAGGRTHLVRTPLGELVASLDPDRFRRIHRSLAVNLERVKEVRPYFGGSYTVVLRDGTRLRLSRGHRDAFLGRSD